MTPKSPLIKIKDFHYAFDPRVKNQNPDALTLSKARGRRAA